MNFLWDIALRAKEQGFREEELLFRQAEEYSPYYEQSFPCVNETEVTSPVIELNLLYRFADIFQDILMQENSGLTQEEYSQFGVKFIDAALHVILYADLRHGLTKREIYIKKIAKEFREGIFFSGMAKDFNWIERPQQERLAALALTQMETGSSLRLFRRAVLILYPNARLYQIKKEDKKLLLYLSCRESETETGKMAFVSDMFLPVGYDIKVFFEYHFGIIGVEGTMKVDETALY
ncbi:MAG: hypothetical protein NC307_14870 [Roseburia sp.]|nr:hypothetical protein [Roseburia sp.]